MMEKMIFGRYIPGDSFVHRLDPRSKLIFVFAFIIIVFIANNTITYALLLAFTLFVIFLSRIRLYFLINGLKPVLILLVFTFLIHIIFTREGNIIFELGFFKVYEEGVKTRDLHFNSICRSCFYYICFNLNNITNFHYRWN